MNLFGWKSRRAPARPLLARGWGVAAGWGEAATARSWVDQVCAAYQDNPVAQRACRLVAGGGAAEAQRMAASGRQIAQAVRRALEAAED